MSDPIRIVHLDPGTFGDVEREASIFERELGNVTVETLTCPPISVPERIGRADVIAVHYTPVTAETMDVSDPSVIAVYATGVDMVDVDAATDRGIPVTRIPAYCDEEVGQHAVSLALALVRGLPQYDASTGRGEWDWTVANPLYTWDELTFGFLAFGYKARAAAGHASALGFDVIAHDPYLDPADIEEGGATPVGFDGLLAESDVLSVHAPLTPETEGLLDGDAFARMTDGAVLINTGRGAVVDEDALLAALEEGPLSGAGLDVLATEPPDADHPLLGRDDVIVTPHVAWNSVGAIDRARRRGTEIAVSAYRGEPVEGVVNPAVLNGPGD